MRYVTEGISEKRAVAILAKIEHCQNHSDSRTQKNKHVEKSAKLGAASATFNFSQKLYRPFSTEPYNYNKCIDIVSIRMSYMNWGLMMK